MATGVDALASEGIFVAGNACLKEPMMFDLRDTCSFDEFDRNRREHLDGLRETGRPKVLKGEDGQEFVVQSAEAYRALLQRLVQHRSSDFRQGAASAIFPPVHTPAASGSPCALPPARAARNQLTSVRSRSAALPPPRLRP